MGVRVNSKSVEMRLSSSYSDYGNYQQIPEAFF